MSLTRAAADRYPARRPGLAVPRGGHRRLWLLLAVTGALVIAAAGVLTGLAARYQPLELGESGTWDLHAPGLPSGVGVRMVNTLGNLHSDIYFPPQHGEFSLYVDLHNGGGFPVTITGAALAPPGGNPEFIPAGSIRYCAPITTCGTRNGTPPVRSVLHDLVLGADQNVFIGIPVRSWPCAYRDAWFSIPDVYISYRFGPFIRVAAVPWNSRNGAIIGQMRGKRGQPGVFCARG
ncbi:MAG: hypothetical protein M0030_03730 [Actinomycetota bacterium]|nr:hypothetical protein [Actinomycetota bacterium]